MVSASEGLIYYCMVFLTALVFLTEASAITTNYEKSNSQTNKTTYEAQTLPPQQRTKSTPTRNRTNLSSKHQNHDRVHPVLLTKLKSNDKIEVGPRTTLQNDEILLSSNSGGDKEIKDKGGGGGGAAGGGDGVGSTPDDDDQKTLLQQVMDGKYGLIQDEIFADKPKRVGVISYDANPEVPKDNINNLGGLDSEDIWLAENHLLVLAGSRLNSANQWMPIDDYIAPSRPVKIPPNPKVPPPFPVQLSENGPVQYIDSSPPKRPAPSSIGIFNPLHLQYANFNVSPGILSTLYGKQPYGSVANSLPTRLSMKLPFPSNGNLPPPVNVRPPVGAEFIPPYLGVTNQSEVDEDDPSLYYPPPYDFYYPLDNTTRVPAGPLVPGIVMPPPPNFFSTFENSSTSAKSKYVAQPTLVRNKPHKENTYKIGKQLQYANNTKAAAPPPSSNGPPSWHANNLLIYNEIINDHKYSTNAPKIKDGEVNGPVDWIPIPAPTPLYITGPKKPNKNTVLVMTDPLKSPGYLYNPPKSALSLPDKKQQPAKLLQPSNTRDDFPSTTPFIYPQLVSTGLPSLESTTPITPYKQQSPTIKATYYFYDEPKFENADEPKSLFTNVESPPTAPYHEQQLPKLPPVDTSANNNNNKNNNRNKFNQKKRPPNAPFIPIYYLAELDNIVDFVKPVTPPEHEHVPNSEYYTTAAKPLYTINKPHYDQPTPKPIFEYSYVASNYNNPGPSSIADSTLGPIQSSDFNTAPPVSNYPFEYNDFYGQQQQQQQQSQQQHHHHHHHQQQQQHQPQPQKRPPIKFPSLQPYSIFQIPVQTTATPILFVNHVKQYAPTSVPHYNFERPWVQDLNLYSKYSYAAYPTENPYYAFFTKEDADLIDENTKKYFTIFGQKIKHGVESTTPLPVIQTVTAPETGDDRYHTKYRTYKKYPSQPSQSAYSIYSTTAVPHKTPTSTDEPEGINKPLYHSADFNLAGGVTPRPHVEHAPSKLAKHIRPIVVQDLPADLNERLKNIVYVRHHDRPNNPHLQFRYTSTDNLAYDNQPYRYPEYYRNKYQNDYREPAYSEYEPSSTAIPLHDDVRVNYRRAQKQSQDPDAEYIRNSSENVKTLRKGKGEESYEEAEELSTPKLISLENDVLVNYRKLHPTNPDAEYIDTRHQTRPSSRVPAHSGHNRVSSASYISPNVDRDRFYFFTPPKTHLAEIEDERYDSQSNVEKPSTYTKRVIEKSNQSASRTVRTA